MALVIIGLFLDIGLGMELGVRPGLGLKYGEAGDAAAIGTEAWSWPGHGA